MFASTLQREVKNGPRECCNVRLILGDDSWPTSRHLPFSHNLAQISVEYLHLINFQSLRL